MKLISEVVKHRKNIERAIKKYGYFAEHNYLHYFYNQNDRDKNLFFDFGNDKILLAQYYGNTNSWGLFPNGVLSPKSERLDLFFEATDYILGKEKAKKFMIEVSEDMKADIINKLKSEKRFRACNSIYILYWPMYNMKVWNPNLEGSKMKKLRNIRNRFYKGYDVEVKDSKNVPKDELKRILLAWLKGRNENDRVDKEYYFNIIDNDFKGFDIAKTLFVNGRPCTITAGWKIPNSNNYYSSMGILDYSYEGLGEVANIDDLNRLKAKGYDYVDFGGSDKFLLEFKKKFRPEKIYKTYLFSIVRG